MLYTPLYVLVTAQSETGHETGRLPLRPASPGVQAYVYIVRRPATE